MKPYFTMKRSEWEQMTPAGRAAMAELAKAIAKAFQSKEGSLESGSQARRRRTAHSPNPGCKAKSEPRRSATESE